MTIIKVKSAGSNVRDLDINGIDLDIRNDKEVEIIPRYLKSNDFRKCLFNGMLRVCEGELNFPYKSAKCYINSKKSNILVFEEDGKKYVKDLDTSEILPFKKEEIIESDNDNEKEVLF